MSSYYKRSIFFELGLFLLTNIALFCGDSCNICGYSKTISALEFHHINPEDKSFGLSSGNCHSIEKDLEEIQKCILVCANCHREIHENFYSKKELFEKRIYDEEKANSLIFTKTNYFCKNCGKQISSNTVNNLCVDCFNESRQITKRPSREELKELIQTNSFCEIGRKFNVSDNTIRKWCKSENLPFRKKDIKEIQDWKKI